MSNKMNNRMEKFYSNKTIDFNQIKKDLSSYIKSIQNILEKKSSTINIKSINKEIIQILKEINNLFEKIINEKENFNLKHYESLLKRDENTIRILYGDLLHEKLLKEILEEKIVLLLQTQNEYELVKEKTGVIVCDGKVICNERKDNEIIILRTENSTLKNVINDKENEIKNLNEKIKLLNNEIIKLKRNKTNINININDLNSQPLSKKSNKFITISRAKEKQLLFNTIYSPGYSSQKEITINNFSSSTKNFYKSYHMNAKIINNNLNSHNKSLDKSMDKIVDKCNKNINININSQDNSIYPAEKLISVNKNKFKKRSSRNNNLCNNKYSSCESILNEKDNKYKTKINNKSNNNIINNSTLRKKYEKKISRKKIFSPLQEYNSVKYINTHSIYYKDQSQKTNRESNLINRNLMKQSTNINIFMSSRLQNSNKKKKKEKSEKKEKIKNIKGQKNGFYKSKKNALFRNENLTNKSYNILFQRTFIDHFRGDNNKSLNIK